MHVFDKSDGIFHLLSEAISEGIIVVDENHELISLNKHAEDFFGYSSNEMIGKSLQFLIPERFREVHKTHAKGYFDKLKDGQMSEEQCILGRKKSGEEFPIEVELHPFKIYQKIYVLALVKDISENTQLRKNLNVISQAIDSAHNGITITNALQKDNPIIYANKAFERMSGYSQNEILNRNCRFLQRGDRDQEGVRILRNSIREGKSCQVEVRNYRKDGSLFWNEVSINPIKDENGEISHFVGIQNDITRRVRTEEEVNHLVRIFNESLNEIYVFDAATLTITHANFGACKNSGYTLEELKQMTPYQLLKGYSKKKFHKTLASIYKRTKKKIVVETWFQRKDGSQYPVEMHLQQSIKGDRRVIIGIILDITDKKNYTEKLESKVEERTKQLKEALSKEIELNELKTKFLSMVSHEFKTPLSAILTSATLVGKYKATENQEKRAKHLNTIIREVKHLNTILNDFLSIERLEKGKEIYNLTNFSLSKVINEVVYNANMMLKSGQKINYPQNVDDITVCQDEKIVSLTLTNLLYNAIKYSPEDTTIDIQVEILPDTLKLHVLDHGIGIPEKDQKFIFERYFRAENVLLTQGTGIGLNTVKTHIENLGGEISFTSKENKGSTFSVILPLDEQACL